VGHRGLLPREMSLEAKGLFMNGSGRWQPAPGKVFNQNE
jgi:hypothetical protein